MDKFNLLDCTLRDGGYITNWEFSENSMKDIIQELFDANMDYIEVGYLNNKPYVPNTAIFNNIDQISILLPQQKNGSMILAMADVTQFFPENITPYNGMSIDGIRVVFYKHQIEEAIKLCESVKQNEYKLFVQPMVTIDYTIDEYTKLAKEIASLDPYAVAIVDSFGYMLKQDFRRYFKILDNVLPAKTLIGFHSHNNMQLAFVTAQDILDYKTHRSLIIDSSLYGMGRGAGNLNTELIANYYNMNLGYKYDIIKIIDLISRYIMPIMKTKKWGYSPYFFLTGMYHCHPNFASYLLDEHDVSVSDFKEFLEIIPSDMLTKCRKQYVEELYQRFQEIKK
jgi:4-hydroxy 2-oxovalerate aldolase